MLLKMDEYQKDVQMSLPFDFNPHRSAALNEQIQNSEHPFPGCSFFLDKSKDSLNEPTRKN